MFIKRRFGASAAAAVLGCLLLTPPAMAEDDSAKEAPEAAAKTPDPVKKQKKEKTASGKRRVRAKIAKVTPDYAYIVADKTQFLGGIDQDFLKSIASKVKRRRGVKRAEVISSEEIRLEVIPKSFKAEAVIAGIEGVRIEMRVPYERIELRFEEGGVFPPRSSITEDNVLVVETGTEVRDAVNSALGFNLPLKMRCVGKTNTPKGNEAAIMRFEAERLSLSKMVPFLAVGDFDGDKKKDLFLRLKGLPEIFVFRNGKNDFRAIPVSRPPSDLKSIPRCEQDMSSYVRLVPKKEVKCQDEAKIPRNFRGDAVELVKHNSTSKLVMWDGKKASKCDPLGEGTVPTMEMLGDREDEE